MVARLALKAGTSPCQQRLRLGIQLPTYNLRRGVNRNVDWLEETQYDRYEPLSQ